MNENLKKNKKETGFTDAYKMTFSRSSRYFGVGHSDLSNSWGAGILGIRSRCLQDYATVSVYLDTLMLC